MCADYLGRKTVSDRAFTSIMEASGKSEEQERYSTAGTADYTIWSAKADYSFALSWADLSVGAKVAKVETASDNSMSGGITSSNTFLYDEAIQALSANVSKKYPSWSYSAGLRGERLGKTGLSQGVGKSHKSVDFDLFPTAVLSHRLGRRGVKPVPVFLPED